MKHIKQQKKRNRNFGYANAAEARKAFMAAISRKGGLHIRF